MNDSQMRKADKRDREDAFMTENTADFPKDSPADKFTKLINTEHAKIMAFDAQKTSGTDDRRQAQEIYENRRDDLVDLLEMFVLAADIVDDDIEGTAAKFKMPRPRTDQSLIAKATSFNADSSGIETELVEAGLDADGRAHLLTIRDAFVKAAADHDAAEQMSGEATGGMSDSFRKMMDYMRRRDKSVRMKYRKNPAKIAAWEIASHLDRAPKGKGGTTPQPPTG